MSLKENLPKFIAEEKYTKEVLEAIQPEIDKIKLQLSKMLLECCISTCSVEGISRFEKDYAVECGINLTFEERKRQVINKMLAKKRLTKEGLINFIKRNIENRQFYISNMAEEYGFKVMLVDKEAEEKLYKALFEARPAHLVFKTELVSYERRCGTFNCNETVI